MYTHLLHSHLLQSLGNAIIHSLWQALVLLIVYKAIVVVKKDLPPAVKHNLSAILVIFAFGWFAFTFQSNFFIPHDSAPTDIAAGISNTDSDVNSLIRIPTEISATLSIAYLVLLSFLMSRLIYSIIRTLRIHTACLTPADAIISAFTLHASGLLKIKRKITVWVGKNISVPATVGFFKPVILLPAACITHLSPQQIEAIILHELSHIRRNDFVLNLVLVTIETILFFNPAVFIFMKTIREERENCCDDLVLKNNYEPLHYAKALLAFSRTQLHHQKLAMNAASRKHQLLYRIKRITGGDLERPAHFSGRITLLGVVALLFFSFAVFENQRKEAETISAPVVVSKIENNDNPPLLLPGKKSSGQPVTEQENDEVKPKIAPKQIAAIPQLAGEISKSVKAAVNAKTLTLENIPDEKTLISIGKNASDQVNEVLKQLSEKKLQALILQQKELWNEKRIQEEIKKAEEYRKSAEKFYNFRITADSVYFNPGPNGYGNIIVEGKKLKVPIPGKKITVTPNIRTLLNFKTEKQLRTADI